MDQIKVASTRKISIMAKRLFCNPNCSGVNSALKTKFKINGNATINGMCFLNNFTKTVMKDMAIKT
jgi:hypothetical protein